MYHPAPLGTLVENQFQSHRHQTMATAYAQAERGVIDGQAAGGPAAPAAALRLADIPLGQEVELASMELSESDMEALLERGVLPGCRLCPVRRSPFGDPIVNVEGTMLALRREMASCLCVRRLTPES